MDPIAAYVKDPDATLDYQIDWATWLGDDTIVTSTWIVPSGLTEEDSLSTTTTATVWLSGGTVGQVYLVTNRVTTVEGRTDDRTIRVVVENR
jgi:hypothetical protein